MDVQIIWVLQNMQSIPDPREYTQREDFSNLSRDLFHVICPFVPDEELYSLVKTGKEVSEIPRKYLRPTQENFLNAVRQGGLPVISNLLRYEQIDPSANNNEAIQLASVYGHIDVVKLLLQDPRVDPSGGINFSV